MDELDEDLERALQHARNVGLTDRDAAAAVRRAAEDHRAQLAAVGVTLVHPELPGQPYVVPEELVEGYANSGWQVAQPELDEPEPSPALVDVELPEQEPAEEA